MFRRGPFSAQYGVNILFQGQMMQSARNNLFFRKFFFHRNPIRTSIQASEAFAAAHSNVIEKVRRSEDGSSVPNAQRRQRPARVRLPGS
jgi:hypothetical protein